MQSCFQITAHQRSAWAELCQTIAWIDDDTIGDLHVKNPSMGSIFLCKVFVLWCHSILTNCHAHKHLMRPRNAETTCACAFKFKCGYYTPYSAHMSPENTSELLYDFIQWF